MGIRQTMSVAKLKKNNFSNIYEYESSRPSHTSLYLWPAIRKLINESDLPDKRVFDIGCGNGATANILHSMGFTVAGIDPSVTGVQFARTNCPNQRFEVAGIDADLAAMFGTFPLVISLEVISFVKEPQLLVRRTYEMLQPGGLAILSATYHGYLKNLALSIVDGWDRHLYLHPQGALVTFLSRKTFYDLFADAGFEHITIRRVGRIPPLAKVMVATVRKPK
jgi:2-polyprenyl-6-hydroxyphenyl methylase/3-demethylubiquinone-9 3-methyltransferase